MRTYRGVYLLCGLVMAGSEIWKQLTLTFVVNGGVYNWWYFPFQLCSVPMYLCLILPWVRSKRAYALLATFFMDFTLLSGIFTFFDTSGLQYPLATLTAHSYLWHFLLIGLGLFTGWTRQGSCTLGGYLTAAGVFLLGCLVATGCNLAFYPLGKINMFYISPHYKMAQVVFRDLATRLGNHVGIAGYILAILLGGGIFHCLWLGVNRMRNKKKSH